MPSRWGGAKQEDWGAILARKVPNSALVRRLRALIDSPNPVASAKALEMVLDARGIRKNLPPPAPEQPVFVVSDPSDLDFS